ncbi:MAG: DUF6655 family protein [Isosphaeraceae bacterium]
MRSVTRPSGAVALAASLALAPLGCGTTRNTTTPRTGTEQLVLTHAWDNAVRQIDFRPLAGVPVFLEATPIQGLDQGYLLSSIRQAMLENGAMLRVKPEEAAWIVEARVGAYGTDDSHFMVGVPQMSVPAVVPGIPGANIPEMALFKKNRQKGVAKLALFAYERSSGRITWTSGNSQATANSRDLYVGGLGPIQAGSIHKNPEVLGMQLPGSPESDKPAGISRARIVEMPGPPAPGEIPPPLPQLPSPFTSP